MELSLTRTVLVDSGPRLPHILPLYGLPFPPFFVPASLHFKCLYHFPGSDTTLSYALGTFTVYDTLSSTWFTSLPHNVLGQEELGSE